MKCVINDQVVLSGAPEGPLAAHISSFAEFVNAPGQGKPGRYQPGDRLLSFLNSL